MASGDSRDKPRRKKRPILESGRLVIYALVGSVLVSMVAYLVLQATPFQTLVAHLAFFSLVTYLVFGLDKVQARRDGRRASELNLLTLGALGGAAGGLLAMATLRHKTQHNLFRVGLPTLVFVHGVVLALVLLR